MLCQSLYSPQSNQSMLIWSDVYCALIEDVEDRGSRHVYTKTVFVSQVPKIMNSFTS